MRRTPLQEDLRIDHRACRIVWSALVEIPFVNAQWRVVVAALVVEDQLVAVDAEVVDAAAEVVLELLARNQSSSPVRIWIVNSMRTWDLAVTSEFPSTKKIRSR